jgi:hypothetical protein
MARRGSPRAIHNPKQKSNKRFGRKAPGLCVTCYDYVQHLYLTDGREECYYCSRGIPKPRGRQ